MKFVEFNALHKKHKNLIITRQNNKKKNFKHLIIQCHNHENHGIHRIPRHNFENHENLCFVQR